MKHGRKNAELTKFGSVPPMVKVILQVFMTEDAVGQTYFAFLLPATNQGPELCIEKKIRIILILKNHWGSDSVNLNPDSQHWW